MGNKLIDLDFGWGEFSKIQELINKDLNRISKIEVDEESANNLCDMFVEFDEWYNKTISKKLNK